VGERKNHDAQVYYSPDNGADRRGSRRVRPSWSAGDDRLHAGHVQFFRESHGAGYSAVQGSHHHAGGAPIRGPAGGDEHPRQTRHDRRQGHE
ncbi:unnamed protein product, partial [Ectocarpus sp. 13 AM-2016]